MDLADGGLDIVDSDEEGLSECDTVLVIGCPHKVSSSHSCRGDDRVWIFCLCLWFPLVSSDERRRSTLSIVFITQNQQVATRFLVVFLGKRAQLCHRLLLLPLLLVKTQYLRSVRPPTLLL